MSHSRKKISIDQIPLYSVTQKLRQNSTQQNFKRKCCEKENHESHQCRSSSKSKESGHSNKKLKKKKFLEEQVQKLLQKRYIDEDSKLHSIKTMNANQLECLRGDLKEMKAVLNKLSIPQNNQKDDVKLNTIESKEQMQLICISYKRKIDDLKQQLQIQREKNLKLEEAHIQSQLFAKQTKDYCESINKELAELASKHIKCQQNIKQLQQKRITISFLENQNKQLQIKHLNLQKERENYTKLTQKNKELTDQKLKFVENEKLMEKKYNSKVLEYQTIQKKSKQLEIELATSKENYQNIRRINIKLQSEVKQSKKSLNEIKILRQKQLQQNCSFINQKKSLVQQIESLRQEKQTQKLKVIEVCKLNEQLHSSKRKIENQFKSLQNQFNNTQLDLGNTKLKLSGLSSMQKKCEELFEQIKVQKHRWINFTGESNKQKQLLDEQLKKLKYQKLKFIETVTKIQKEKKQSLETIEVVKNQSKRFLDDKIKLSKQIKQLQEKVSMAEFNSREITKEKQCLLSKVYEIQNSIKSKQSIWLKEKENYECKVQWLQKQKRQIQSEVKGTLQVVKVRTDEIQSLNITYQQQIKQLNEERMKLIANLKRLQDQYDNMSSESDSLKTAIGIKQNKIVQLEHKLSQSQFQLKKMTQKCSELEQHQKTLSCEWLNKYENITKRLQGCESELKKWKQIYLKQESQLQIRQQKLQNLSTIRSHLQQKLHLIELQLHQSDTIRLSLSSELEQQQNTTRRIEATFQQQKSLLQDQINMKNKSIYELKETIKSIRQESKKIQQEMEQYNKLEELEQILRFMTANFSERLKNIQQLKNQLQLQINILKSQNNDLSKKVFQLQENSNIYSQQQRKQKITALNMQVKRYQQQLTKLNSQKQQEIKKLKEKLQQQRSLNSTKLLENESTINTAKLNLDQQSQNNRRLTEILQQKQKIINEQQQKLKLYEQKRIKIINEVHMIQNQISELALRNNMLEEQKTELEEDIVKKQQKMNLLEQKIKLVLQANSALQEQKVALIEQSSIIKGQACKQSEKIKIVEQKHQKNINQIYEICQMRKNEAVNQLKDKIKELAGQLTSSITKLNIKNKEIQSLQEKYQHLEQILQENHQLLNQQRQERQKIMRQNQKTFNQLESIKIQLNSKERDLETFIREKTILREKIVQHESKYESLRRKYQSLEHDKYNVQKQYENQNITLRVLKEENKNIEKVMTDQINQRKIIIEQLMNEKRMLYAQLHHQR